MDDWPALRDFICDCYGSSAPFKSGMRWRWQFVDTPYGPPAGGQPPVWVAVDGARVVGQIALQPARMFIDGQEETAGWIVDVMIRPEYRGLGLGHRIHDAMVASGQTLVTLTMAEATRRIAERAGAITLGPVYQMIRPGRLSGRTVATVLKRGIERRSGLVRLGGRGFLGSRIGPMALAAGLSAAGAMSRRRRGSREGVEANVTSNPDLQAAEGLFDRCLQAYRAQFDRRAPFLEWRMLRAPDLEYRWIDVRRGSDLAGLGVFRFPDPVELPVGTLVEALALPTDSQALDAIVEEAVSAMSPATEAIIAGASDPALVSRLRHHGFHVVKTHFPTVVSADETVTKRVALAKDAWRFTKADHDWDQVHPAED